MLLIQSGNHALASEPETQPYTQSPLVTRTSSAALGQILIKFRPEASPEAQAAILRHYQLRPGRDDSALAAAEVQATAAAAALLNALNREALIEYAEPDYIFHAFSPNSASRVEPNDRYFSQQWGLAQIRAPEAWSTTTGKAEVVIAVVDTGVDLSHPDLAGKLVDGASFVRGSSSAQDNSGHGTHVASTAAGASNNQIGVTGVGWATRIMPVKVLDEGGSGRISDIADGIQWAVDHGADIVNLSLGGSVDTRTLRAAIDYADREGVLVVAATGNDFSGGNATNYPAAYDNVLAVAASDQGDKHAEFSNSGDFVDIAAPGVGIFAATWRGIGHSYATYDGTSMSTPFVSGVAALLLAIDPELTVDQLATILKQTAMDIETGGWDPLTGHGRVDAAAAVASIAATIEPGQSPPAASTQHHSLFIPVLWGTSHRDK